MGVMSLMPLFVVITDLLSQEFFQTLCASLKALGSTPFSQEVIRAFSLHMHVHTHIYSIYSFSSNPHFGSKGFLGDYSPPSGAQTHRGWWQGGIYFLLISRQVTQGPCVPNTWGQEAQPEGLARPDAAQTWPLLLQQEENPVKMV